MFTKNSKDSQISNYFIDTCLKSDNFLLYDNNLISDFNNNSENSFVDENKYLNKKYVYDNKKYRKPDDEYIYKINRHGFRSKHFSKLSNNKKNVVVSGCSVTFGIGLEEELMWINQLLEISQKKDYDCYNLSISGGNVFSIVNNFRVFCDNYGAPEYFIVLAPNFQRSFLYDNHSDLMANILVAPPDSPSFNNKTVQKFINMYELEDLVFSSIMSLHMLEYLCEAQNTKLLWSTWHQESSDLAKRVGFKHFIEVPTFSKENPLKYANLENIDNLKRWEIARDNVHPGSSYNRLIANNFAKIFGV